MGEIADMMIEGEMCSYCGEYLGAGDGYSRLCKACAKEEKKSEPESKKIKKQKGQKK